jgi:hypothetical protein
MSKNTFPKDPIYNYNDWIKYIQQQLIKSKTK